MKIANDYRTCNHCQWKYPPTYIATKCKRCKNNMDTVVCTRCLTVIKDTELSKGRATCRKCTSEIHQAYKMDPGQRREDYTLKKIEERQVYEDALNNWVKVIHENHPGVLTEAQWRGAINYFNGCFICNSFHIEVRHQIVDASQGGKYSVLNTLPMCGTCNQLRRWETNPFKWYHSMDEKIYNRVVEYLGRLYEQYKN